MISTELQEVVTKWYVHKTYGDLYENLHRDTQADINNYFDSTGNYGQVLSDNDWAALCKEWARTLKYIVNSRPDNIPTLWEAYINLSLTSAHRESAKTEPEAIFAACQWILGNKE